MSQKLSQKQPVYIVSYARTPFGSLNGSLSTVRAADLGACAIGAAIDRAGVKLDQISEVILGNVLMAGQGQAPARQAALGANIPNSVPAFTLNKMCGSGMKAIMLGVQSIILGESEIVVAGGMESMSLAPYIVPGARAGLRMGNAQFIDSMIFDGLWDPYTNQHMGNCGDLCAREKNFSRADQDAFATESFKRAQAAQKSGKLKKEIAVVTISTKKGDTQVEQDEGPSKVKFEKIPQLKPVFAKDGTVTAANASTINDGAAALILASETAVKKYGLNPIAKIVSSATHAQAPEWFTTAPGAAMKKAIERAGWKASEIELYEVNEAFAVVAMAAQRELEIRHDRLNIWGGAISLGHPIGASGARIVGTLVNQLIDLDQSKGCAGICIGGGEATSICVERV